MNIGTNLPWKYLYVLGCAQNCQKYLPKVIGNIQDLCSLFDNSEVLIFENDSTDSTKQMLLKYAEKSNDFNVFSFLGLNETIPVKTERLAHLRRGAMAWLRQHGALHKSSLVLVIDLDEVNSRTWELVLFREILQWFAGHSKSAAIFANQLGPYYDLWALRHPSLSPDDIWERQFDGHLNNPKLTDQELFEAFVQPRMFTLPRDSSPLLVESAFGGLGFYKGEWLSRCAEFTYRGSKSRWIRGEDGPQLIRWQCAEHVSFHFGLRALGADLWVHPNLINWCTDSLPNGLMLNPSSWRYLQF